MKEVKKVTLTYKQAEEILVKLVAAKKDNEVIKTVYNKNSVTITIFNK